MGFPSVFVNGVARLNPGNASLTEPTEIMVVPQGGIKAGAPVTLPHGRTFRKVKIELNGEKLAYLLDFHYVGRAPRSKVRFTFDLRDADRLRFTVE